jgi:hypothetical protein
MPAGSAVPARGPVISIAEAIARMAAIDKALPASDGLACFNRMYLAVTQTVDQQVTQGFFADAAFMTMLDVVFANRYFAAADAASAPATVPQAWRPLVEQRANQEIEPIQFALAGMNAHINHDLPLAVVATCADLGTAPDTGSHLADFQKVDQLLDAAEQSVRQSFESAIEQEIDAHLKAVDNLVACWSLNSARDLAWQNSLVLWALRSEQAASALFTDGLATATAMASRLLLTAV